MFSPVWCKGQSALFTANQVAGNGHRAREKKLLQCLLVQGRRESLHFFDVAQSMQHLSGNFTITIVGCVNVLDTCEDVPGSK